MTNPAVPPTGYRATIRSEAKKFATLLTHAEPQSLISASKQAALNIFRLAATKVPAYRHLLIKSGVAPNQVRRIKNFDSRVPVLDKANYFAAHDLPSLCVNGSLTDVAAAYTSSGFSKTFSWGVETAADGEALRLNIDILLETHFAAARRSTLLINALPMGVKVPAGLPIVLDTGPRADACLAAVKTIGPHVQQIVLVGEHPFIKRMVEEGAEDRDVAWKKRRVFVVTGGEWVACNFAKYIGKPLGHDPRDESRGHVMVNLGVSEIGLSVGIETPDARRVRRLLRDDAVLRQSLLGDTPFVPVVTQYLPHRYYIETPEDKDGQPRLIVTTLDPGRRLPLVRYTTGDWARVLSHAEVSAALKRAGHAPPQSPLPFIAMWGRGRSLRAGGKDVYPEQIKEAIYADAVLAHATTGDFRMKTAGGGLSLRVQLSPGTKASASLAKHFESRVARTVGVRTHVTAVNYGDFSEGLDVGYQRKFRYLG